MEAQSLGRRKYSKVATVLIRMPNPAYYAFLALLALSLEINSAFSVRIAGFHTTGGSQYINTRNILEELATRGHEVACCVLLFCMILLF